MNLSALNTEPRLLMEADLRPASGNRFQPTGFADLGAAEYTLPISGTRMLLVESAQSVANRLEKTCLDGDGPGLDPALEGLPYVIANLEGTNIATRTSSLVEAHRIGSPYFLLNKELKANLVREMGYAPALPLDWKRIYATLFKYDPNSLVHGVVPLAARRRPRARAARGDRLHRSAECRARGVRRRQNSPVDPTGKTQVVGEKAESGIYSNVPYARVEYVAEEIKAYFNLDLALIRGYRLGDAATELLIALSLLKVRRFLDTSLRLRTACDFVVSAIRSTSPTAFELPGETELLTSVQAGIKACASQFASPSVTILKTLVKVVEKASGANA